MADESSFEIDVLPLQSTTIFPSTVIPLAAGRPRSVGAVEQALATEEKLLGCITVREGRAATPESEATPPGDLYEVGTLVMIKRMTRSEDALQLIVQGIDRVRVVEWTQIDPHLRARVQVIPPPARREEQTVEALFRNVQQSIQRALALLPEIPPEVRTAVLSSNDPVQLAYFLGSILNLGVEREQQMLEAGTVDELLMLAFASLKREIGIMELRKKIAEEAQRDMEDEERRKVLRHQMKAIMKELGEDVVGGVIQTSAGGAPRMLSVRPNTAFIMMWMEPSNYDLVDVSKTIKRVCESFGVTASRADDVVHQEQITKVVLKHIEESQLLIADLTGERPNVYYEVGYAHAVGKNPILFRKHGTKLHFDLSVHNVLEYRNLDELEKHLSRTLVTILGRKAG